MKEQDISPFLYPNPVVLVSVEHENESSIIAISWIGTVCSVPPMISISVQPKRFSHHIIEKSREFVINIPTKAHIDAIKLCGSQSGRTIDKWQACHFTRKDATSVKTPLIQECPVNIECKVENIIHLGTHDLFISRIVNVHVDKQWQIDGYPDMLTYSNGHYYRCEKL